MMDCKKSISGTESGQDEIYNHSQHNSTIPGESLYGKAVIYTLAILVS